MKDTFDTVSIDTTTEFSEGKKITRVVGDFDDARLDALKALLKTGRAKDQITHLTESLRRLGKQSEAVLQDPNKGSQVTSFGVTLFDVDRHNSEIAKIYGEISRIRDGLQTLKTNLRLDALIDGNTREPRKSTNGVGANWERSRDTSPIIASSSIDRGIERSRDDAMARAIQSLDATTAERIVSDFRGQAALDYAAIGAGHRYGIKGGLIEMYLEGKFLLDKKYQKS